VFKTKGRKKNLAKERENKIAINVNVTGKGVSRMVVCKKHPCPSKI
jgi:hypothetical protein